MHDPSNRYGVAYVHTCILIVTNTHVCKVLNLRDWLGCCELVSVGCPDSAKPPSPAPTVAVNARGECVDHTGRNCASLGCIVYNCKPGHSSCTKTIDLY